MTPLDLVDEMLDGLPKKVWKDHNLKWLDPANGCGIFPAVIVNRLMEGLKNWEPNEDKRYKHIMEKMIHVCELQPKNMFIYLCAFDPKDRYTLNIHTGSFLTEEFDQHAQEIWGVEKFDVIVGNPPYQRDSENGKKTHPIWDIFTEKALGLLNQKMFLTFIHPPGWRAIDGRFKQTGEKLKGKQLLTLKINDAQQGLKRFGANTRFDFYTLKNEDSRGKKTEVTWQDGSVSKVELGNMKLIPNECVEEVEALMRGPNDTGIEILHSYSAYETRKPHMQNRNDNVFKFPCVANVDTKETPSKIYYSNTKNKGHFGIPKIITSRFGITVLIDKKGEFGMTQDCTGIIEKKENLENLKTALLSEKFRRICDATNVGGLRECIDRKVITLFRKDFWKEFI